MQKNGRIGEFWRSANYSNSSSTVIEQDFKTSQIQIRV